MSKIINNIDEQINIIQSSLEWANKYNKGAFPKREFKEYRRQARKIKYSLVNRCSIAAYGESQVGKSYLMSSLLSTPDCPFEIKFNNKAYSFVNEINPSGGNSTEIESTGVITRFTTESKNSHDKDLVKIQNLSIADILMLIVDSYYSDVKINAKKSLTSEQINLELLKFKEIWKSNKHVQIVLDEDEIRDIQDYLIEVVGVSASSVINSNFFDMVSENIKYISADSWPELFELLWNKNENFSRIFRTLLSEYKKINYQTEIYVPYEAILRENGTLMQIQWLDLVCGKTLDGIELPVLTTNVHDKTGNLIASNFPKTYLSAFAAEITLILPSTIEETRPFLKHVDLLDFPGARNRLDKIEDEIDYTNDMPEMLRRGKVAYIFNHYVRTRRISSIMFCHHHSMKKANLGNIIKDWVEKTVGLTPSIRKRNLKDLDNISPLFIIATKFNKDLSKRGTEMPGKLANHWERFTRVLPEIIGSAQWFENWQEDNGGFHPFKSIYPLRDFYWSSCGPERSGLFDGYSDGTNGPKSKEVKLHIQEGYPEYFEDLYKSFIELPFVQKHFSNPIQTWEDVIGINHDGSEPIIRDISKISEKLYNHRESICLDELRQMQNSIFGILDGYHDPEDDASKNIKLKSVSSKIKTRLFLAVAEKPEIFGRIIDSLMIETEIFRKIAKNIIVLRTETPKDYTAINFLRAMIGINPNDNKETNINKLCKFFNVASREDLEEEFANKDYTIDEVISDEQEFCATESDVITKHILQCWTEHLNNSVKALSEYIPYPEEVILSFQTLLKKLGIKERISFNIAKYEKMFSINERLNAISDYASLELNNFISTVGRKFMNDEHINEIKEKAERCGIYVDLSAQGIESSRKKQSLNSALAALDDSADILKQPSYSQSDMDTLRRLPLWDNFQRWQNLLLLGMILSSGVSTKDPVENQSVKELIDRTNSLYI